jgi:hypothetical protein
VNNVCPALAASSKTWCSAVGSGSLGIADFAMNGIVPPAVQAPGPACPRTYPSRRECTLTPRRDDRHVNPFREKHNKPSLLRLSSTLGHPACTRTTVASAIASSWPWPALPSVTIPAERVDSGPAVGAARGRRHGRHHRRRHRHGFARPWIIQFHAALLMCPIPCAPIEFTRPDDSGVQVSLSAHELGVTVPTGTRARPPRTVMRLVWSYLASWNRRRAARPMIRS